LSKEEFAVMATRYSMLALLMVFVFAGCGVSDKVVKDIPVQEMDKLNEDYVGKDAWTRSLLIDLGPEGVIDRDTKVKLVSLDMHWTGSVTVKGPNKRNITHAFNLERPLTMAAIEEKLNKLFYFSDPEYRYRMNLRKYGKKTAKAIFDRQLFKGMKREAAIESWGYPDDMNSVDISGKLEEQWIYKDVRQKTKKRYIYIRDGQVDNWEE